MQTLTCIVADRRSAFRDALDHRRPNIEGEGGYRESRRLPRSGDQFAAGQQEGAYVGRAASPLTHVSQHLTRRLTRREGSIEEPHTWTPTEKEEGLCR